MLATSAASAARISSIPADDSSFIKFCIREITKVISYHFERMGGLRRKGAIRIYGGNGPPRIRQMKLISGMISPEFNPIRKSPLAGDAGILTFRSDWRDRFCRMRCPVGRPGCGPGETLSGHRPSWLARAPKTCRPTSSFQCLLMQIQNWRSPVVGIVSNSLFSSTP